MKPFQIFVSLIATILLIMFCQGLGHTAEIVSIKADTSGIIILVLVLAGCASFLGVICYLCGCLFVWNLNRCINNCEKRTAS